MNNTRFILESCFNQRSDIFIDEEVFEPSFIPESLVHREVELETLAQHFKPLLNMNGKNHGNHVIIQGSVGLGKSTVVKQFGATLEKYSIERTEENIPLILYFHLNCRRQRSWNLLFTSILRQLISAFPARGYSAAELFECLQSLIKERNQKLLLCLDEIDYLLSKGGDFLYSLIRNYEGTNAKHSSGISLVLITRNPSFQAYLDSTLYSSLSKRMIIFHPYNVEQLFDILLSRAKLGLKSTSYSHQILKEVASLSHTHGDARYAIELLWRAAKMAESSGKQEIHFEHVRKAQASNFPIKSSIITSLPAHQRLVLLSIARLLQQYPSKSYAYSTEIIKQYEKSCEEVGEIPRKLTQFWSYLRELKINGFIQIQIVNRHKKGRSEGRVAKISINDLPVRELISLLSRKINTNDYICSSRIDDSNYLSGSGTDSDGLNRTI